MQSTVAAAGGKSRASPRMTSAGGAMTGGVAAVISGSASSTVAVDDAVEAVAHLAGLGVLGQVAFGGSAAANAPVGVQDDQVAMLAGGAAVAAVAAGRLVVNDGQVDAAGPGCRVNSDVKVNSNIRIRTRTNIRRCRRVGMG